MQNVVLVTDTIACLTRGQIEEYGIAIIPMRINYDGHEYREFVDITASEAYQLLEKNPERFVTSPPSPGELLQTFRELGQRAKGIACITVSSKLSAQYSIARLAAEQVQQELPDVTITVLDSMNVATAQGLIVLAAARTAARGGSILEVAQTIEGIKPRIRILMVLETIRHVYRSGRVPKVAARVGAALGVKPILTVSDGVVRFVGAARNKHSGISRIMDTMKEETGQRTLHVAVMHAEARDEAQRLMETISSEFTCAELWLSEFSPIMGYATGRGLIGIAYYSEG